MKHKLILFTLILILRIGLVSTLYAGNDGWQANAQIDVSEPGIIEAVLSPELYTKTSNESLDLELTGPDGHLRSFELYWHEPVGPALIKLVPTEMKFEKEGVYIWEGKTEQKISADQIHVEIADDNFVGRVDIEGFCNDKWIPLKKDQVLFKANKQSRSEIEIDKNVYRKIRLHFKGFDKKYENTFIPVLKVFLIGKRSGKNYVEEIITPNYEKSETDGITLIKSVLPGSGLFIQSIHISTQAQFQGFWQIGAETIENGEQKFSKILNGSISSVSKDRQRLSFDIGRSWPYRNMMLKLDPKGAYIGDISGFEVKVRLLRMIFSADAKGLYIVKSGTGKQVKISHIPQQRPIDRTVLFSLHKINKDRRPENLVEKYKINGGPFDDKGFTWKSEINVPESGYYNLLLNMTASLDNKKSGIRLVKDNIQTPYFFGKNERKEVDLSSSTISEYVPENNRTTWTVQLPCASSGWSSLSLHASGIFNRIVQLETPKPGNMGWNKWKSRNWQNDKTGESLFAVDLTSYPADQNRLRITIGHGNNQPLKIPRITASYIAPSINFIAREKGVYLLYGGNPDSLPPNYDLSLVQSNLLEQLPNRIQMGQIEPFRSENYKKAFYNLFTGRQWGLYAVLGLITLVMLFLIAKLFPKTKPQ